MIEVSDPAVLSMAEVVTTIRDVIAAQAGLVPSKHIIDHSGNTAGALLNKTFSLDLQTDNTGKFRDDVAIRMGHDLAVTVVWLLRPSDQTTSQIEALTVEQLVMRAMLEQVATSELRATYVRTSRALSAQREYLILTLTFRLEHDWYSQPLASAFAS